MSEERCRLVKAILLAVLVVGSLSIGFRIANTYQQASTNDRYRQYDERTEYSPDGGTHRSAPEHLFYDSRSGDILVKE